MILAVGSYADEQFSAVVECLRGLKAECAVVDCTMPRLYIVGGAENCETGKIRVFGGECVGSRPVGSVYIRYPAWSAGTNDRARYLSKLAADLDIALFLSSAYIMNLPAHSISNYSKPYQLHLLSESGFTVPRTLVTSDYRSFRQFWNRCSGNVIVKGVSNVRTVARRVRKDHSLLRDQLRYCPTLFQEYIDGPEYRVHVVKNRAFISRIECASTDYRVALSSGSHPVRISNSVLPSRVLKQCIDFTRRSGLALSGIDFIEGPDGSLYILELNPYPQFRFYERCTGQPITLSIAEALVASENPHSILCA